MTQLAIADALITLHCAECSMLFGASDDFIRRRREDGQQFYCPQGHSNVYHDTELKRLQRENERLQIELTREKQRRQLECQTHASEIRGERIKRGKAEARLKRTETRVHAGVCPHCNRTFKQLAAHMRTKHPDLTPHVHRQLPV